MPRRGPKKPRPAVAPSDKAFGGVHSGARRAALQALLETQKGRFPEEALEEHAAGLDRRDRALAAALVYGVLRWQARLEWTARSFLKEPDKPLPPVVRTILSLGLFQLLYLDRVPARAAVNESVALARAYGPPWAPGLVNAVLRAVTRAESVPGPETAGLGPLEQLALSESHPLWLVQRWAEELGLQETAALLKANNQPAPLTLRVNPARTSRQDLAALLGGHFPGIEPTSFSPVGLTLPGPTGPVRDLPGFAQGLFAVQDEAGQLAAFLARPAPGGRVLDACAGRGGKALHLAALAPGRVWALDLDRRRLRQAAAEARRLGLAPLPLIQGDLLQETPFRLGTFEVVLVDAPCSNLGVIRRRPDVKWLKSAADPARLAQGQERLLAAAARLVAPGGRLVYAVCTLTPEETQEVVQAFQSEHQDFALFPARDLLPLSARVLCGPAGTLQAWPHKHATDGFFAAVFQKR